MASRAHPVLPSLDAMEPERPPPALISELLEEIFLRVASPADLARATAACVSFRRLISDPSFPRRYRSVHPPPLLGFLSTAGFHPVESTHPSAAAARAVARTADFSLDFFLPRTAGRCRWCLIDVRDGRVLVRRTIAHVKKLHMWMKHRGLAVCDPLFERYLLLPPITDDLLASVGLRNQDLFCAGVSLIPSRGMEEETPTRVICWMSSKTRLSVFIFSTSSGQWAAGTSMNWADLGLYGEVDWRMSGQCVYGCFYWKVNCSSKLVKLDMNTMELSTYDLPPHHEKQNIVIVESGEGKVGMFSPHDEGTSLEYYTLLQNGTDNKYYKWHFKSTIPLPDHGTSNFFITRHAEGYIFLAHLIEEQDTTYSEFVSLEVKSLTIEIVCRTSGAFDACPYFGFPPSMTPRRIQGYGED